MYLEAMKKLWPSLEQVTISNDQNLNSNFKNKKNESLPIA